MKIISTIEELNAIYGGGLSQASVDKVTKALTPLYRGMIEISPFVALATIGPEGLDCSPRGDIGGVVRIVDDTTLYLPDWRGNNRVDSLSNIVRDPRLSLMFLIPGSNTVMRINGRGVVSNDEALLESFEMDGKHPRTVIVISIVDEMFGIPVRPRGDARRALECRTFRRPCQSADARSDAEGCCWGFRPRNLRPRMAGAGSEDDVVR